VDLVGNVVAHPALEQHAAVTAGGDGADRAGGSLVERDAGELAALASTPKLSPPGLRQPG